MSALLDELAAELGRDAPVDIATMFRSPAIRCEGKITVFLGHDDRLILKLPRARAVELLAQGTVDPVTMGTRTMREWVSISRARHELWLEISREALAYVRGLA